LVTSVLTTLFVIGVLILTLSILNLSSVVTTILASAGVAGLAIGLALQDPIMNLFSGVMMSTKSAFRIGDLVETNDYFGTIKEISLRSTVLVTPQGEEVLIPNKDIYHNALKNYSVSGKRRVDLSCGISYGDNLDKVRTVATEAVSKGVKRDGSKQVEFFYEAFGDSSINFQLRFWLEAPSLKDYLYARSEAIIALKNAFDENDIMIPFPIRTLDFGIKGGEKLSAMINSEISSNSN
jgi:small conductance mechanosensitive channel